MTRARSKGSRETETFVRVQARQEQEVGEHGAHPVGLAEQVVDELAVVRGLLRVVEAAGEDLGVGPDQGQRRLELVGGVSDKRPSACRTLPGPDASPAAT